MNKRDFERLAKSAAQGGEILRGERAPSRQFTRTAPARRLNPASGVWALCLADHDEPHLTTRRLYQVIADRAEIETSGGSVRIVNDVGKIFRYPAELFALISLPNDVTRTLRKIA